MTRRPRGGVRRRCTVQSAHWLTYSDEAVGRPLQALTKPPARELNCRQGALLRKEEPAMAQARMPDAFFDVAAHHLPPDQPVGPEGGRPPVRHRVVMNVLWFVLATGCRWEDVPPELGCSGMTAHRYLRRWE